MNFEVRVSKGEWKDYPYKYGVFLDDELVWSDDYQSEQTATKIFKDFVEAMKESWYEIPARIQAILSDRTEDWNKI